MLKSANVNAVDALSRETDRQTGAASNQWIPVPGPRFSASRVNTRGQSSMLYGGTPSQDGCLRPAQSGYRNVVSLAHIVEN